MYNITSRTKFFLWYWILSFTWALPTTIFGGLIALILIITGHKPKRFINGHWYFPLSNTDWGLGLGLFSIVDKDETESLICHEYGHHLQACFLLGPFTLFIATIPSIIRFWLIKCFSNSKFGKQDYDAFWVEEDASARGSWIKYLEDTKEWTK